MLFAVNKEKVGKPVGTKFDIGVKIANEELSEGRREEMNGLRFGTVCD